MEEALTKINNAVADVFRVAEELAALSHFELAEYWNLNYVREYLRERLLALAALAGGAAREIQRQTTAVKCPRCGGPALYFENYENGVIAFAGHECSKCGNIFK